MKFIILIITSVIISINGKVDHVLDPSSFTECFEAAHLDKKTVNEIYLQIHADTNECQMYPGFSVCFIIGDIYQCLVGRGIWPLEFYDLSVPKQLEYLSKALADLA